MEQREWCKTGLHSIKIHCLNERNTSVYPLLVVCGHLCNHHHSHQHCVVGQHPDPDSCSFVLGFSNVHIYDVELEIIPAPVNKEMMHLPFVWQRVEAWFAVICFLVLLVLFCFLINLCLNKPTSLWSPKLLKLAEKSEITRLWDTDIYKLCGIYASYYLAVIDSFYK